MIEITKIEYLRHENARCISIDSNDGLYVTDDNIITHNSAIFCFALCAVTAQKASEIYIEPIQQLLESSSFWHQCRTHHEMIMEDKKLKEENDVEYISWRPAGKSSVITSGGGLAWKQISSAGALLGMQILAGAMTEITFFLESGR